MQKIIIIGSGQLGSRHLQALASIAIPVEVRVIDPSEKALEIAKERVDQVPNKGFLKTIEFSSELVYESEVVDIVIIATNSDIRKKVLEELIATLSVRYIILEKVAFQSIRDFQEVIKLLENRQIKAWVNCPRRMFPFYQKLQKNRFQENESISYHVQGGQWGLGSNSIHFLDHLAFLSGETNFTIDSSGLDQKFLESKRKGFLDFTGTIHGYSPNGSNFSFVASKDSRTPPVINIMGKTSRFIIFESEGRILQADESNRWEWEEIAFQMLYQSQLTHLAVTQILKTGESDLTPLEQSFRLHRPLLEALTHHLEHVTGNTYEKCPIT